MNDSFEPEVHERNYLEALSTSDVDVEFLDDIERALFSEARMGEEVMGFLNTDAGRMIRTLVKTDVIDNVQTLKTTAPWRKKKITELQNKIRQGEMLLFYLADVIQRGEVAYMQLHTEGVR